MPTDDLDEDEEDGNIGEEPAPEDNGSEEENDTTFEEGVASEDEVWSPSSFFHLSKLTFFPVGDGTTYNQDEAGLLNHQSPSHSQDLH